MKHPLAQLSKALELLEKETAEEYQKVAVVRVEEFLQVMKGQQYNINQHLDQAVSYKSQEIQSIINTIFLCDMPNILILRPS